MEAPSIQTLKPTAFRRLTGVKRTTFATMLAELVKALQKKKARGGRPNELTPEQMLRMPLEYLREYRTLFHISKNSGISESNCYYAIRFVEDVLIKSGKFSLPGKKALVKSEATYEVVIIDASASPIDRPKKNNANTTQEKRSVIQLKHSY